MPVIGECRLTTVHEIVNVDVVGWLATILSRTRTGMNVWFGHFRPRYVFRVKFNCFTDYIHRNNCTEYIPVACR